MEPTPKKKDLSLEKPRWLKTEIGRGETFFKIKKDLRFRKLVTVCEEAKCPNISTCWNTGTATFMILGDTCTRACRFCHVKTGDPAGLLDQNEPQEVAESVRSMKLNYLVLTMVDRDDLPDGGANHIEKVVTAVRELSPKIKIELLAGDFKGEEEILQKIAHCGIDVFSHNIETVKRLTPRVRDARAHYEQSLRVLDFVKEVNRTLYTKSSLMLGLGEKEEEILESLKDLRDHGVSFLTLGQYMRPTKKHLSVKEWVKPEIFDLLKQKAYDIGFLEVASGPLVRSSYRANELYELAMSKLKATS
jgi:lipoic acid synthetase